MKILHISTIIEWRGGDNQMLTTYSILKDSPDLHQIILCPENSVLSGKCKAADIPCYTASRTSKFSIVFLKKIIEIIKKENLDIVHVHDSNALTLSLFALRFAPPVKLVYSRKRNNMVKPNFFKNLKYNNSQITGIICVSQAVKNVLLPVMKDHSKIQVIYDGINVEELSGKTDHQILHKEFGIERNAVLIGNVAGLTKQKDLFTFLSAAREITDLAEQPICFFIFGEGPLEKELKEHAESLNLSGKIFFTGFRNDISSVLPELDIFMISSQTEGLPLSILEAFACKVPVVATAAGGTGEAVINRITGMISPVKDHRQLAHNAIEVLKNSALRETMVDKAFDLVQERFSLKVMQKNYYAYYKNIGKS